MAVWNPHGVALSAVPDVELSSGYKMPILGLGTWQAVSGEVGKAVEDAIDIGYRHFDCALIYENEEEIGNAIKRKVDQGVISREDVFLTTKLPVYKNDPECVREAISTSLKRLKTSYVDLYLVHAPVSIDGKQFAKLGRDEFFNKPKDPSTFFKDMDAALVWKEMEKLVEEGFAKSIGLSNFNEDQIQHVLNNCRIKPAVLQVECHPYLPQEDLQTFCRKNYIVMTAYAPLGSAKFQSAKTNNGNRHGALLQETLLGRIGEKHGKTSAQILLRWLIQRNIVAIPKSVKKERLQENFELWDFCLSEHEMGQISGLAKSDGRMFTLDMWSDSPNYPFK
ncbi:1,5-anhydro-D-fructose reductase-like [Paramacrobiotus metropolitanus]|uniref:1,5-anhydro-D-fructose reductase-like n=1 Tax=Paramacrobiotus metropolitanus TaxID=2943436 RepID=UPI002445822B|nr:1,5-anhydro-D-fructose reductase-like [Paramacrobiotus metropolitanus]